MTTARTLLPRPLALLALALLALLGSVAGAAPALAHDHLVSSDPADGAQLEASPERITLSFSADIMDVSPVVRIVDAEQETVLETTPSVEGTDAVAELAEPLPAGDYTVQWRVVSSDGHPIEGEFAITVAEGAAAPTATEQPAPAASDAGGAETTAPAAEETAAAEAPAAQQGGNDALVPVFIGLGVIVVIGVVLALRAGRRGQDRKG